MVLEESVPVVQDDLLQEAAAVDDPGLAVVKAEDQRATAGEVTQISSEILVRKRRREALEEYAAVNGQYVRDEREQIQERKIQALEETVANMRQIVVQQSVQIAALENHRRQSERRIATADSGDALADQWLHRVDTLHITLRAKGNEPSYDQVKIALLDTGLSASHVHARHISAWKDFVTESDAMADKTGHGSIGVDIIYKLFPSAQVFVARVFDDSEADARTQDLMAKAIQHARKRWKVNIIVLASGFEPDHDDMRDEIMKAKAARILVFAAASNRGNATHITFPARMHGDVMCMFASDGNVKATAIKFNPSPSKINRYNFAILGKEVLSSPLARSRVSGTSISSFIGAAIAGLVIDFSRQSDCRARVFNCQSLLTINGMNAVFAAMAAKGNDGEYHCVAPWEVLGCLDPTNRHWSRDQKRRWICDTISRILEKMEKT